MVDLIKHVVDFFKDRTTSWGFKSALIISIIAFVLIGDFFFNISYNYQLNNKIDQLTKIQTLKKEYKNDAIKHKKIIFLEKQIINEKHYTEIISNLFYKKYNKGEVESNEKPSANNKAKAPYSISTFWMIFSANYGFIMFMIIIFFIPFLDSSFRKGNELIGWIASLFLAIVVIVLFSWIAYQIPIILNYPIYNYFLNALLQGIILYVIYRVGKK